MGNGEDERALAPSTATCRLCGGEGRIVTGFAHSVTSEAKVLPVDSSLHLCEVCGHLFTTVSVNLRDYYEHAYDSTLTDGGSDELVIGAGGAVAFRTDVDYAALRQALGRGLVPSAKLFEYGCGRGRILSRLRKDGFTNLHAYDVSELYRAPVAALIGDAFMHVGDRPLHTDVDAAYSLFVLEHDERPDDALSYLRSVLKPGGLLFVMVPDHATNLIDLACADHVHHFSSERLRMLVEDAGFDVLAVDDTSQVGSVSLLARNGERRAASAPAQRPDLVSRSAAAGAELVDYLRRLHAIADQVRPGQDVYLYGAGFYGAMTAAALRASGHEPAGIFDANTRKLGTVRLGHPVQAPEAASRSVHGGSAVVVCVNRRVSDAVVARLSPIFEKVLLA